MRIRNRLDGKTLAYSSKSETLIAEVEKVHVNSDANKVLKLNSIRSIGNRSWCIPRPPMVTATHSAIPLPYNASYFGSLVLAVRCRDGSETYQCKDCNIVVRSKLDALVFSCP